MQEEDQVGRRNGSKPTGGAADLVDKTFAAWRVVACRGLPEIAVGLAKLGEQIGVPPSGPRPEILFAKAGLHERIELKGERGFQSPARRAANRKRICRQFC